MKAGQLRPLVLPGLPSDACGESRCGFVLYLIDVVKVASENVPDDSSHELLLAEWLKDRRIFVSEFEYEILEVLLPHRLEEYEARQPETLQQPIHALSQLGRPDPEALKREVRLLGFRPRGGRELDCSGLPMVQVESEDSLAHESGVLEPVRHSDAVLDTGLRVEAHCRPHLPPAIALGRPPRRDETLRSLP